MSIIPDSNEPQVQVDRTPLAGEPGPAPAPPGDRAAVGDIPGPRAWIYAVGAALVAGMMAWGVGEKTHGYYAPSSTSTGGNFRDFTTLNREKVLADRKSTALAFGTLGALLGLLSGAAGGALRRSIPGGAGAALAGLVLGGLGAAVAGYGLAPIFARFYSDESPSLLLPFLVRGGIWAVVGMAAGLALGCGWRGSLGIPRALIGGLAGSLCGTIAFEVVNAVLFPAERNDAVIPSSATTRLLACLLVSLGAAIGVIVFARHRTMPAGRATGSRS